MRDLGELASATDQDIDEAVLAADPMVLRGLMYQLTGDQRIVDTSTQPMSMGFLTVEAVVDHDQVGFLQSVAADFLKTLRDSGEDWPDIGSAARLRQSLGLVAGDDVPERDMPMWLEELALDPWARSAVWPQQPAAQPLDDFHVLVIGTGMNGLNAAIQLQRAGIPHTVVEKNPAIGGTWYENRYPGARVDTPSRGYCHVYGAAFDFRYPFCPQSENERYLNWLVDTYEVRERIEFNTEVKSLVWDEAAGLWQVAVVGPDGPREWRVPAVMTAVGFLSRPSVPDLEGAAEFDGEIFHSARWPEGLDISGKRVAVIGSGCSGYQVFPEVARTAAHTYLFQRTPSWVFDAPGYLSPYPPAVNWMERSFPYFRNFLRFRAQWLFGPSGLGRGFRTDPDFTARILSERMAFIHSKLGERPDLLEKMVPEDPPMSSRPVLVDQDYCVYDALLRPNSTLVTSGIARLTATGIVDAEGNEHPVDVIVLATGFKANDFLWPMEVRGRRGRTLDELWAKDGARAYLGTMLPGFPNLFTLYGPNTNPVGGPGVPAMQEGQTRFALACMQHLILEGKRTVDVGLDAYWTFNQELDDAEATKMYVRAKKHNYYTNSHGRSAANCPFDGRKMWEWFRDPTGEYAKTVIDSLNAGSAVRPHFGRDLIVE